MKQKHYILTVLFVIAGVFLQGQTHHAEWVELLESSTDMDTHLNNVMYDGTDIIVNGYYQGDGIFVGQSMAGDIGVNSVIAKITTDGDLLWTTTLTSDNWGTFYDMAFDSDNNIVLAGWNTSLDTIFVNGEPVLINDGQWLTFGIVMKISGVDGSLLWFRYMTSTEYAYLNPTKVSIDENDEIFVTGYYSCPFEIDQIEFPYDHDWGDNFFFLKFNAEGTAITGKHLTCIIHKNKKKRENV